MNDTGKNHIWPQNEELSPWLDRSDALAEIEKRLANGEFDSETARRLRQWHEEGYFVIPGLIEEQLLDDLLASFDECYRTGRPLAIDGYSQPLKRNAYGHYDTVTGAFMELEE